MKYVVTLKDKTYEVEVEHGEAMILDEYEVKAPAAPAPVAAAAPPVPKTRAFVLRKSNLARLLRIPTTSVL